MKNPLEYIRQHPQLAKQLIGLNLPELENLIQQAIALDEQRKKEAEVHKIRVNKKGAGRGKNLSADEEICLTLFYLRQMTIFEVLGMMFDVSRTTFLAPQRLAFVANKRDLNRFLLLEIDF